MSLSLSLSLSHTFRSNLYKYDNNATCMYASVSVSVSVCIRYEGYKIIVVKHTFLVFKTSSDVFSFRFFIFSTFSLLVSSASLTRARRLAARSSIYFC